MRCEVSARRATQPNARTTATHNRALAAVLLNRYVNSPIFGWRSTVKYFTSTPVRTYETKYPAQSRASCDVVPEVGGLGVRVPMKHDHLAERCISATRTPTLPPKWRS